MSDSVGGRRQQSQTTGARHKSPLEKGASCSDMSLYKSSADETIRYKSSNVPSVNTGSEKYFECSCDRCNTAGGHVEAQGFCTNCDDYLCGACFTSHSRNKVSRSHALLDKDNMPKITVKLCDPCKKASDEEAATGYCTDCGEYLCGSCFRSHSRNKASRQHMLLDKDNMPQRTDSVLTSHIAKMNINTTDADTLKYNEEYTYIRDIKVKTKKDKKDCFITDMTLVSSTALVLSDKNNKSLKLADLVNNVIKDGLTFKTPPGGLTTISQDEVAVVLDDKCKIISASKGLSVMRTLNTNGKCIDVKSVKGKLFVSFKDPVKFQILQLTGAVQKTINPDSEVLKHCTFPRYMAVSLDESVIYVSDWNTNKVMFIDINGNMISMFQGELDWPFDITISPFGSVFLCNRHQHVVNKMTSVLSQATVILGQGDGLFAPQAMCFNPDTQQLYISSGSGEAKKNKFLKVYKWK